MLYHDPKRLRIRRVCHPIFFLRTVANPNPHSAPHDAHSDEKLLINASSHIPTTEDTPTIEAANTIDNTSQHLQETLAEISSQIASLADAQSRTEDHLLRTETLCQETASQINLLIQNQTHLLQHFQKLEANHNSHLQSLEETQATHTEQLQQMLASNTDAVNDLGGKIDEWRISHDELGSGVGCGHNVHPPPRKIDRPVVGYDYGMGGGKRGWRVDRAPGVLRC